MTGQMTPAEARVVDPVLSTHARGYRNAELVGDALFPRVAVPARGAKVLRFGKESFQLYNARRAPGAATRRVQYGHAADTVAVVQDALEGMVPVELLEEAAALPGLDLGQSAVEMVMDAIDLITEKMQADLASDPASYAASHRTALTGTDRWTDPGSSPRAQMDDWRETIRASIGRRPNTLVVSPAAFNALARHGEIREQFKYTMADSVTADMLARYFQLKRVAVGEAVWADDAGAFHDVWDNVAVLAWVPDGGNFRVPAYGYTYELPGMPMVEQPYLDRNAKSWLYPVTHERRPYLVGADAGFLIETPV